MIKTSNKFLPSDALVPETKLSQITHLLCWVTPEIAKNWLGFNHPNNRNASSDRANATAKKYYQWNLPIGKR